jgi:hypothetical protein
MNKIHRDKIKGIKHKSRASYCYGQPIGWEVRKLMFDRKMRMAVPVSSKVTYMEQLEKYT